MKKNKEPKLIPLTPQELMSLHGLTVEQGLEAGYPIVGHCQSPKHRFVKSNKKSLKNALTRENLIGSMQAAEILKITPKAIVQYCERGKIQAVKIGRFWGIPPSEIERIAELRGRKQ